MKQCFALGHITPLYLLLILYLCLFYLICLYGSVPPCYLWFIYACVFLTSPTTTLYQCYLVYFPVSRLGEIVIPSCCLFLVLVPVAVSGRVGPITYFYYCDPCTVFHSFIESNGKLLCHRVFYIVALLQEVCLIF